MATKREQAMLTWKTVDQKYGPPVKAGYLGKILIGQVTWSTSGDMQYAWQNFLPGMKAKSGYCKTEEEGMERISNILKAWINYAELQLTN